MNLLIVWTVLLVSIVIVLVKLNQLVLATQDTIAMEQILLLQLLMQAKVTFPLLELLNLQSVSLDTTLR